MGSLTLIQTAPGVCYDYQHFITNGHVSIAGKTDKRYVWVLRDTGTTTGELGILLCDPLCPLKGCMTCNDLAGGPVWKSVPPPLVVTSLSYSFGELDELVQHPVVFTASTVSD